jgi:hypothetical protein
VNWQSTQDYESEHCIAVERNLVLAVLPMAGADKNLSVIAFRDGRTDAAATVLNSTPEEPTTFTVRDWLYLLWSGARCQRKLQAVTYIVDRPK